MPLLIKELVKLNPRFVAITGDFTNGGSKDKFSVRGVDKWWSNVHKLLMPLRSAGIPVLPIPGNHDLVREKHRKAYARAWSDLAGWTRPLVPKGMLPLYYSVNIDGVHLSMLNFGTSTTSIEMFHWLKGDLERARNARMRLAFGHVPLRSSINRRSRYYSGWFKKLAGILADHDVAAYFAGHEHLIWDETVDLGRDSKRTIRQVICGTAGAVYRYGLHERLVEKQCNKNRWCVWPNNGRYFRLTRRRRRLSAPITFVVGEVRSRKLTVTPHLFKGGQILAYPRSPVRPVPGANKAAPCPGIFSFD